MPTLGSTTNMFNPDLPAPPGRRLQRLLAAAGALLLCGAATAFQIAPMGSEFESKLTNETEATIGQALAQRVATLRPLGLLLSVRRQALCDLSWSLAGHQ